MIDQPIEGASAWRRADIKSENYRVVLSPACLDEIRRAADDIRAHPLPTILRSPADFDLTNCHAAMAEVRHILTTGVRFAVVDRLPLDELGDEEAQAIYWLLSSMVARPVAQKLDGTMIYNVWDTGKQALPGSGVRPDSTNIEIRFHIDNAYNTTPPEFVGLLCLRTAKSGGVSRVLSFHTVYNRLLRRAPRAAAAALPARSGSTASASSSPASRRPSSPRCSKAARSCAPGSASTRSIRATR